MNIRSDTELVQEDEFALFFLGESIHALLRLAKYSCVATSITNQLFYARKSMLYNQASGQFALYTYRG
jgi:hypothetical protein